MDKIQEIIESFGNEYDAVSVTAKRFCSELTHQLSNILEQENIALGFPIEYRVKELISIGEKVERNSLNIESIMEIPDLIGLRIILLFLRDVDSVRNLISKHFDVIETEDKTKTCSESEFGYSSLHFIIKLPSEWLKVPTLTPFKDLTAELQVRTLSQHIWATASHKLQYKKEESVPFPVKRSIHRVSALLEIVDLEFERILSKKGEYREQLKQTGEQENSEKLNVDILEQILDKMFPAENKDSRKEENFSELLVDLFGNGITTVGELKNKIVEHIDKAMKEEKQHVKTYEIRYSEGESIPDYITTEDRINKGVFYTHSGLLRNIITEAVGRNWLAYKTEIDQ